jgi:hypothetical protein
MFWGHARCGGHRAIRCYMPAALYPLLSLARAAVLGCSGICLVAMVCGLGFHHLSTPLRKTFFHIFISLSDSDAHAFIMAIELA